MCHGDYVPKSAEEAAKNLATLINSYCGVTPSLDGLIRMLQTRWDSVTLLAHKIHDARPGAKNSPPV